MWAMLSFIFECANSTFGNCTRLALRIRVNMSEIVSVIGLPARFGHTGNQAIEGRLAESHARAAELAQITPASSTHRATVHHPGRAGVARQLRQAGVVALGFQFRPERGIFLHRLLLLLIPLFPCFLGHKIIFLRQTACPLVSTGPTLPRPSARPSKDRVEIPRKSRMRGSAAATSRSKNSYIASRRKVTRQPMGWLSRSLKFAMLLRDL